jgi:hypothetical protein
MPGAGLSLADLCSEVAPARKRGRYVVMNHIGLVAGLAVAFWYVLPRTGVFA